ncbi:DUF2461 domain-containing protein [Lutimonas saemankumensis]|uniref:DUF2461 domain-containing protein n=1 Tax=Lutimonas saemankumensis TaxID=483016 RepID=UPI001CD6993F|nr:DUF2461 domain-containing protein [Lutimonas saemankumensis]MCA0933708.1 DUF2461 domain-containing protein [Lutimonas saemankumensis]
MPFFTSDYLEFFKELAANNHKDWFDANRKRYETVVRDPFKEFITLLIDELAKRDSSIDILAKDAIFRINRDIRFSKDKTPYKLQNSAIISKEGRKNKNYPGIYLELGPERFAFYGGIYMPDPKQTLKVRSFFKEHSRELQSLLSEQNFRNNFGEIHGEKSKRIPKDLQEAADSQPLIMNKQWYYYKYLPPETILSEDLLETILDLDAKSGPVKDFLIRAIC